LTSNNLNIPGTICRQCILPETFPGIKFNDKGICKYCQKESEAKQTKAVEKKSQYKDKLDSLIKDVRDKAPVYDVIMAFSGGKDSSYTLKLLKERYNLRILALTFDNHFVSPVAFDNVKNVTDTLEVDSSIIRPPWSIAKDVFSLTAQKDIFSKPTLLRASSICTACIGMVKSVVLKTALEMSIPLVGFGWSPGQAPIQSAILKTNPSMIKPNQDALRKAYPQKLSDSLNSWFIPKIYFEKFKDAFPYNIHPLAFFDYDEEEIKVELRTIGWQAPEDTDTNSSNCLINAYANKCHIERHGFHPYVWEIANMVRQGVMSRDEGLTKIYTEQNSDMVDYAQNKLRPE
jgi:predicted PP-loop superfamily ATPase